MATRVHPAPTPRARGSRPPSRGRSRAPLATGVAAVALLAVAVLAFAVATRSGVSLHGDPRALARVHVETLGGTLTRATATDAKGRRVGLTESGGRLTPRRRLASGEQITVDVTVRRPGWLGWALGKQRHQRLSVTAPTAAIAAQWITVPQAGSVRVRFSAPVDHAIATVGGAAHYLHGAGAAVSLGRQGLVGTTRIAAAARSWERPGKATTVHWFPQAKDPVVVSSPAAGTRIGPADHLRVTFARPVDDVLGSRRPTIVPATPGRWTKPDAHTLEFVPAGYGVGFGATEHVRFGRAVSVVAPGSAGLRSTDELTFTTPPGSTLRLQQLLAEQGYLPLRWTPLGAPVARTRAAEARAATRAPDGRFSWRYSSTPHELVKLWQEGRPNTILRGAIMKFQDEHALTVDAVAGPGVWRALLDDAVDGNRHKGAYSYVYVHRDLPQRLTLWSAGHTVLTSPGNTGVPAAPTQLGSFPVFEHIPSTTMSGTNPDGSTYHDPGVRFVSYFNGGDALHAFNRASFGTPQSLGCVELPLATARSVFPYTPIGTLVTIEH